MGRKAGVIIKMCEYAFGGAQHQPAAFGVISQVLWIQRHRLDGAHNHPPVNPARRNAATT